MDKTRKRHPHKTWAFEYVNNMVWHFTSLGGFAKFVNKIQNYPHISVDCKENRDIENLKKEIASLRLRELDANYPKYVQENITTPQIKALIDTPETKFH